MLDVFVIDNIFVQLGGLVFHQTIGIPIGTNCAPLLVDFYTLMMQTSSKVFSRIKIEHWPKPLNNKV